MSKLSKLIKTPDLYFKDALQKHFSAKKKPVVPKKQVMKDTKKPLPKVVERYTLDSSKTRINLVIIDNTTSKEHNKKNIIKYQLRSIEKYCNFASVNYVSKDISIISNIVKTFKTYAEFYSQKVLATYPKNEVYVFINLNFFFLKKVHHSNFVSEKGKPITYFKKNKGKTLNLDNIINKIIDGAEYNFTPMENLSITSTMSLIYLDTLNKSNTLKNDYLLKIHPTVDAILSNNFLIESPIQYARLDSGYIEKFVWIQSVHGSNRCPLGITFDKDPSNEIHYYDFLDSLFPHTSSLESSIKII